MLNHFLFRRQHELVPERELEGSGTRPGAASRRSPRPSPAHTSNRHIWTRSVWRSIPGNSIEGITYKTTQSMKMSSTGPSSLREGWVGVANTVLPSPDGQHRRERCGLLVSSHNVSHGLRQLTSRRTTKSYSPSSRIAATERTVKSYCYGKCSKNIGTKYD